MPRHQSHNSRQGVIRLLVGVCLIAVGIVGLLAFTGGDGAPVAAGPSTTVPRNPAPVVVPPDRHAAAPVRIRIPSIDVNAAVNPLFVQDDGTLQAPDSFEDTGWWYGGPEPGEAGAAVIAGHVDSDAGPAVFYRLDELESGDRVFIDRADGSTVTFTVQRTARHPKDDFPTKAVYGDTRGSQLRLVTCGGEFDEDAQSYLSNIIVFATRTA